MDLSTGARWMRAISFSAILLAIVALFGLGDIYANTSAAGCPHDGLRGLNDLLVPLAAYELLQPLALAIAFYTLLTAFLKQRWVWLAVLSITVIIGIGVTVKASSALSRQVVELVLGPSCGNSYSIVATGVAFLLIACVEAIYIVWSSAQDAQQLATPPERSAEA